MQQFVPISTSDRLSIQTSSPIQLKSPTVSRQGNFTLKPGLIITPRPIFAPNRRSKTHRCLPPGIQDLTNNACVTSHKNSTQAGCPRLNPLLSNRSSRIFTIYFFEKPHALTSIFHTCRFLVLPQNPTINFQHLRGNPGPHEVVFYQPSPMHTQRQSFLIWQRQKRH